MAKRMAILGLAGTFALPFIAASAAGTAQAADAVEIKEKIRLFNGKDLSAFDTWLAGHGLNQDPARVFTVLPHVDGAPAIRVSGEVMGGLLTKESYKNYKLVVEYRWGLVTWPGRTRSARDSGILIHSWGEPGNMAKDFKAPWGRSIEFQIIEGGVGDILLLGGFDRAGAEHKTTMKIRSRKDRDGESVYDKAAPEMDHSSFTRVNWWGRDEDWADKLDFRGPRDADSPAGAWTRLEAIVEGGSMKFFVNGKLVNEGRDSNLTEGKLLFQSELAELYFRRIDLEPLPKS